MGEKKIRLSAKSWSSRLIKFVFDINPDYFNNFCYYFWTVVISIIILPITLLIYAFTKPTEKYRYRKFIKSLDKSQLYYLYKYPMISSEPEVFAYFIDTVDFKFPDIPNGKILEDAMKYKKLTYQDIEGYKEDYDRKEKELIEKEIEEEKTVGIIEEVFDCFKNVFLSLLIIILGYLISLIILKSLWDWGQFFICLGMICSPFIVAIIFNFIYDEEKKIVPKWIKKKFKKYCPKIEWKDD